MNKLNLKIIYVILSSLIVYTAFNSILALFFYSIIITLLLLESNYHISKIFDWAKNLGKTSLISKKKFWGDFYFFLDKLLDKKNSDSDKLNVRLTEWETGIKLIPDGIVMINNKKEISWANIAAETFLNFSFKKEENKAITSIIEDPEFHLFYLRRIDGEFIDINLAKGTELFSYKFILKHMGSKTLLIIKDITGIKKTEKLRKDFIANVSHELKTPLTVILGYVETIKNEEELDPNFLKNSLKHINLQSYRMKNIVDNLLVLSKLESKKNTAQRNFVDVNVLVKNVLESIDFGVRKNYEFLINISKETNLMASMEELHSAILNLVINATTYSSKNSKIEISWKEENENFIFSVADNGIGIDNIHLERLTERFYRVDSSRHRDTGGTGLGLSIVKHVVNRHQAELKIQSKKNVGSSFKITFPTTRLTKNNQ